MKTRRSIRFKVTSIILSISLISLLVLGGATLSDVLVVRSDISEANKRLGTVAAEDSAAALEQSTRQRLSSVTEYVAELSNEKLNRLKGYAVMLSEAATKVFSDPAAYPLREINPPCEVDTGKLSLYYIQPEGVTDAEVRTEAQLAANCSEIMEQLQGVDSAVQANYISFLDTGLHVVCDESADKRLAADYAGYDPRTRGWFQNAVSSGRAVFSDLTDDALGRGYGIVCSAPFYDAEGNVLGAVGVGALIVDINDMILSVKLGETGEAFVLDKTGSMMIGKDVQKDESGASVRIDLHEGADAKLEKLLNYMTTGGAGVERVTYDGREVYMGYAHIDAGSWTLVTVIDVDEALKLSELTAAKIMSVADSSTETINAAIRTIMVIIIGITLATLAVVLLLSLGFSRRLTTPILRLTEGVNQISSGDLDTQLKIQTGDEIEQLADSFNGMTARLKEYIANLTTVTAEKERIGAELNVATQIQQSMLPCIFPPFPEHSEFDIFATMEPAKEVGGDFYDFFLVDDNHLAVVIADVSGKGVPAALFMVIAKTLIKNHAQQGETPAAVFTNVNRQLCESNDAGMFVTAWMGILEISTGRMTCVNAGHNPPLIRKADGSFEYLKMRAGFVLAGMEGIRYRQNELDFGRGDTLFIYTDGVTEATSSHNELFGEERLKNTLDAVADPDPNVLPGTVKRAIDDFIQDAPQFDDITMLALRLK